MSTWTELLEEYESRNTEDLNSNPVQEKSEETPDLMDLFEGDGYPRRMCE